MTEAYILIYREIIIENTVVISIQVAFLRLHLNIE